MQKGVIFTMKNARRFLTVLLTAAMTITFSACAPNYKWSTDKLPKPSSLKGEVLDDDNGSFAASIECSEKDFQKYADQCRNSGFNAEEYSSSEGSIFFYHPDGSVLRLSYANGIMSVDLTPPITFDNIEWPNNAAALQLPKPSSDLYGQDPRVTIADNYFRIYVGNTSHSDFDDYIEQCKEAGFNDISVNEPVVFEASNGKYTLILTYAGLDVMCVHIFPN